MQKMTAYANLMRLHFFWTAIFMQCSMLYHMQESCDNISYGCAKYVNTSRMNYMHMAR